MFLLCKSVLWTSVLRRWVVDLDIVLSRKLICDRPGKNDVPSQILVAKVRSSS